MAIKIGPMIGCANVMPNPTTLRTNMNMRVKYALRIALNRFGNTRFRISEFSRTTSLI